MISHKKFARLFTFLTSLFAATACSTSNSTEPPDNQQQALPSTCKSYDASKGGLQIECIYFDQAKNLVLRGVENEWITLTSDRPVRTAGWRLNAGDSAQDFFLPDTVFERFTIYTKQPPDTAKGQFGSFMSANWLWNNTEPDVARLYDDNGRLVDTHTYDN